MLDRRAFLAAGLLAAATGAAPARAQDAELRVSRPLDLTMLPLLVMEHEHLIERVAEATGVGKVTVRWSAPGKGEALAPLATGDADFAAVGLAPFLFAADAGGGQPDEVRALAAIADRPFVLVTRNPKINTIRDFAADDRIAVPALRNSQPALLLEMAAAQEWGPEHFDKLDPLTVARPDATAADELIAGKGGIDAHFSRSPYVDDELGDPKIRRVMDSFDIAGPHSVAVLATTRRFGAANPDLCKAILAAVQSADDFIKQTPGAAAEIYAGMNKSQDISLEDLSDMIGDPDLAYRAAPSGVLRLASFAHRIGRLKRAPQSWQDLFLAEAKDLKGS